MALIMIDWIYLQAKNARIKNHVSRAHSEQAAQDMPCSQARSSDHQGRVQGLWPQTGALALFTHVPSKF